MTDTKEAVFPNGAPQPFQVEAIARVSNLFRQRGVDFPDFRLNLGAERGFYTSFVKGQAEYVLTIYPNSLNMMGPEGLYEIYMPYEFESEESQIHFFMRRLTRFLKEDSWELPEE